MASQFELLWDDQICSLGYLVADWIEAFCCHGPGDVQGEAIVLDEEWLDYLVGAYRLDPLTGRRIVDEAVLSRPKGRAKSELAGFICVVEALGPSRFAGWNDEGQPVGRPVVSPLIKCLATEENQTGNTFENVAFICGEWGKDNHPEIYEAVSGARAYQSASVLYLRDGGEIRACTSGAASKDGGKESHICADETHLYVTGELRSMYATLRRNMGSKRMDSQPWANQTTTAYRMGEMSIAEETMAMWRRGELNEHTYVDHREAKGKVDLLNQKHTIAQLRDVFGPASEWQDLERKYRDMVDPRICPDEATAARYYLNRVIRGKDRWCDATLLKGTGEMPKAGEPVALGFDGSLSDDSTALWGCRISDAHWFRVHLQENDGLPGWKVDTAEVDAAFRAAFTQWDVRLAFCDPWGDWRVYVDAWADAFGTRVREFDTRHQVKMAAALDRVRADINAGTATHDGDESLPRHVGNAIVRKRGDLTLIFKDRPDSPRKIDVAMAATLARAAREQALKEHTPDEDFETYYGDGRRRGGAASAGAPGAGSSAGRARAPGARGRGVARL